MSLAEAFLGQPPMDELFTLEHRWSSVLMIL